MCENFHSFWSLFPAALCIRTSTVGGGMGGFSGGGFHHPLSQRVLFGTSCPLAPPRGSWKKILVDFTGNLTSVDWVSPTLFRFIELLCQQFLARSCRCLFYGTRCLLSILSNSIGTARCMILECFWIDCVRFRTVCTFVLWIEVFFVPLQFCAKVFRYGFSRKTAIRIFE